jgi:hypothetical protein
MGRGTPANAGWKGKGLYPSEYLFELKKPNFQQL